MKITVITICHNSAKTLQKTISSVQSQNYEDTEYIIIDGNSDDNTSEIINDNRTFIDKCISENDQGIYDAMNKGIRMATGDVISFLNSDDFYAYPDVLKEMGECLKKKNADACYADLVYVDKKDSEKVLRTWKSGDYTHGMFLKGWMPPHPTFFVKKNVYEEYGKFNVELGTAADYEIMLRFLHKYRVPVAYLPKTIIKMRTGGASNASWLSRLNANTNDRKAWRVNSLNPKWYTTILKPLRKVNQFI